MKRNIIILATIVCMIITILPSSKADAATKQYGIAIADKYGNYTFYDLNYTDGRSGIEVTSGGNVMIPLSKITSKMPALKYSYNSTTKVATVTNIINGKKIVNKRSSIYCYYYSSSKSASSRKTMPYKMYLSNKSSAIMIHMSALKWIMNTTDGFHYYGVSDMQTAGYDTSKYSGLIVYNPYTSVTKIPKSTSVIGISKTVKVTIPEGYSMAQIFNLLVSKGVSASTSYLYDAANNYDFTKNYPLIGAIPKNVNRCFLLEGYLYPDTYEFYRLSKGSDIIGKLLKNTETKITEEDRSKAESLGYSMDEILTIASLIQKESGNSGMMPSISSVLHNRLNQGMKLQLDASINYVERYIKPYITGDINRYNEYYNTYKCSALPAGPICSPGRAAINAALNPANTDYLFFYSDDQGVYHFSAEYVNPKATPVVSGN